MMDWLKAVGIGVFAAIGGVVVAVIGIFAIFIFAIFGALMGAITGFILQIVPILGPLVKQGFITLGIQNPDLVAIGAALGFIAGFFKSHGGSSKCEHGHD
jgi:hypothetical protein